MSAPWDEITAGARITLPPHTHEAVSGFAHMARNGQGAEPGAVADVHEERWPEDAIARAERRRKEQEGQ